MPEVHPGEALKAILDTLTKSGLAWIAEEIDSAIQAGKLVRHTKEQHLKRFPNEEQGPLEWSHKKKTQEELLELEPLTDAEKLKIALRVIQHYVTGLNKAWGIAQDETAKCLEVRNIQIVITDTLSMKRIPVFEAGFPRQSENLDRLLRQAWPKEGESYDLIKHGNNGSDK